MNAPAVGELMQLESAYRRAEQTQASYGAYQIARDEASAAWTAWVEAIVP